MYVTKKIGKLFIYESRISISLRSYLFWLFEKIFHFSKLFRDRERNGKRRRSSRKKKKRKRDNSGGKTEIPAGTRRGDIVHVLLGPLAGRVTRAALVI